MATFDPWAGFDPMKKETTGFDPWSGFGSTKTKTPEKPGIKLEAPIKPKSTVDPNKVIIAGQTSSKEAQQKALATPQKPTVVERAKESVKATKQIASDVGVTLKERYAQGFQPLGSALVDYIKKPEKTSTAKDIAVGAEVFGRGVKETAKTSFALADTLLRSIGRAAKDTAGDTVRGKAAAAVADNLAQTLEQVHTELSRDYKTFNQVEPSAAEMAVSILGGGSQGFQLVTTDLGDLALAAASEVPGLNLPVNALRTTMGFGMQKLSGAFGAALEYAPGLTQDEKKRAADALAVTALTFVFVKGFQTSSKGVGRVFEKTLSKVDEVKAKRAGVKAEGLAKDTSIEFAVRSAVADVLAEDGSPELKHAFDAAYLPKEEGGRKAVRALTPTESLTFEAEMRNNSADEFNGLGKQAAEDGFEFEVQNLKKTQTGVDVNTKSDPFDFAAARYDLENNRITFNYDAVSDHVRRMYENGESIIYGDGKFQKIFRRAEGESFNDLRARYIRELFAHEKAHADTVSAEDISRLRQAEANGDKVARDQIIADLEARANKVTFRKTDELVSDLDADTIDSVTRAYETIESAKASKGSTTFGEKGLEELYQNYRKIVTRNTGRLESGSEELVAGLLQNKRAYPDEGAVNKALFNFNSKGTAFEGELMTNDDFLTLFRERFKKEIDAKTQVAEARQTLREAQGRLEDSTLSQADIRKAVREAVDVERVKSKGQKAGALGRAKDRATAEARRMFEAGKQSKNPTIRRLQQEALDARVAKRFDLAMERTRKWALLNKLKDKAIKASDQRKTVLKYMKAEGVPKDVRGQFLQAFAHLRKASDTVALVERMTTAWNKRKRTVLKKEIAKELKRSVVKMVNSVRKGKYTAEVQNKLDTIRRGVKESRNTAFDERVRLVDEHTQKSPGEPLPDALLEKLEILETFGIKEQSVQQLERTLATIQSIAEVGKTERMAWVEKMKTRNTDTRKSILAEMPDKATGLPGVKRKVSSLLKLGQQYNANIKTLDFLTDFLSKNSKKAVHESVLSNFFRKAVARSNEHRKLLREDQAKLRSTFSRVYGIKEGSRKLMKKLRDIRTNQRNLGKFKGVDGKEFDLLLTKDQMMQVEGYLRDPDTKEQLMNKHNGMTEPMFEAIRKNLDEQDMRMVDEYMALYREKYDPFSEAVGKDTGVLLGFRPNYIPRRVTGIGNAAADQSGYESLLLNEASRNMVSSRPGSARARSDAAVGKIAVDGMMGTYGRYVDAVDRYVTHWDYIRELNGVFAGGEVRQKIIDGFGEPYWNALSEHIDEIKLGTVKDQMLIPALAKVQSNVASALMQSFNVVAGQFSSAFQFAAESPRMFAFTKGTVEAITSPVQTYRMLQRVSSVFDERYADAEVLKAISGLSPSDLDAVLSGARTLGDTLNLPLVQADKLTTTVGAMGLFRSWEAEFLHRGFTADKAAELAGKRVDSTILRTQSTQAPIGKSLIEKKGGTLGKLFITFTNQPQKILQTQAAAIRGWRSGRMSLGQAAKILLITGPIMQAFYETARYESQEIQAALGIANENEEPLSKKILMGTILQPLGGLPLVGDVAKLFLNRAKGLRYSYRPSIMFSTIDALAEAVSQAGAGDLDTAALDTMKFMTQVTGIGYVSPIVSKLKKLTND